jgi:hypothetical protein
MDDRPGASTPPESSARKSSEAAGNAKVSFAGRPTCQQSRYCPSDASSRASRAGDALLEAPFDGEAPKLGWLSTYRALSRPVVFRSHRAAAAALGQDEKSLVVADRRT